MNLTNGDCTYLLSLSRTWTNSIKSKSIKSEFSISCFDKAISKY